ncbi:hypothetical protein C5167_018443 [Papaver somniferum]|uniref:Uncharacterized protein n=1 Tax=Papaver somniferum TaxID=3469 RepID=A0A4Y7IMA6_PAPSO|nr:hypothetical protein C5167_018443 [Papaver somniferum]
MRSERDEEKSVGPFVSRLHVYDTAKGGPRATPRNKMVLCKYLSIPSQRFNSRLCSTLFLPPSNTVSSASASMSQGGGRERAVFSPYYIPPPAPHHFDEEIQTRPGHVLQNRNPQIMQFIMHMLLPQLKEHLPEEG